jgi:DNA polymerase III delta prime subunit
MNTHHARLFFAESLHASSIPQLYKVQSVDVQHIVRDRFSIDDARELSLQSSSLPVENDERVFVLVVKAIALEAQNALLKLLEEPPKRVAFIIVAPQTIDLLATLRSRIAIESRMLPLQRTDTFVQFKNATVGERLQLIAEKTKAKDHEWVEELLMGAEVETHTNRKLLSAVVAVRSRIAQRGASAKMLLEELALSV